ncbi:S-type pyocin domain-containing protein [Streptomyces sp. NBC_01317]|uniref:S-type pyocin domain-containing protein n=1 Tax=Streptomyces sp. NBC_01317 TaxID=2903822 RepID=UPI002E10772F|nr:S-type pyocin domain-containing protein [Streptomyces sp. NBC_01317]
MRVEENHSTDDVIAFLRPQETAESVAARRAVPDTALETDASPATVLKAERGIINTGTVHGGQHVTTIELPGHVNGGADGDI